MSHFPIPTPLPYDIDLNCAFGHDHGWFGAIIGLSGRPDRLLVTAWLDRGPRSLLQTICMTDTAWGPFLQPITFTPNQKELILYGHAACRELSEALPA